MTNELAEKALRRAMQAGDSQETQAEALLAIGFLLEDIANRLEARDAVEVAPTTTTNSRQAERWEVAEDSRPMTLPYYVRREEKVNSRVDGAWIRFKNKDEAQRVADQLNQADAAGSTADEVAPATTPRLSRLTGLEWVQGKKGYWYSASTAISDPRKGAHTVDLWTVVHRDDLEGTQTRVQSVCRDCDWASIWFAECFDAAYRARVHIKRKLKGQDDASVYGVPRPPHPNEG